MFKLIMPVPSPNGTNKEGLYMTVPRGVAYDALPSGMRRRFGRDEGEVLSSEETSEWVDLILRLDPEDRQDLKAEFEARARREEPDNYGEDRRRPHRIARDMPPVRPSDIVRDRRGPAVGIPTDTQHRHRRLSRDTEQFGVSLPEGEDRRRAGDGRRYANDSAAGRLPSFDEIWGFK